MRLPILMYHKVDRLPAGVRHPRNYVLPEQFDAQLAALRRWGYETISFDDWLGFRAGGRALPERPIILTFDDGYRSVLDVAWPSLAGYGFRATLFVVSGLLGGMNRWDADEVQEPLLDSAEVLALQSFGLEIGSHGCTHRALRGLSDADASTELVQSRRALERLVGRPVLAFCYPYGQQDARIRSLARGAGYGAAVVCSRRLNSRRTNPLRLARLRIDYTTSVTGLWGMLKGLQFLP